MLENKGAVSHPVRLNLLQQLKKKPTFFQKNKQAILKQTNTVITNLYYVFFRETPSLSAIIILCVQKKVLATLAPGYTV